MFQQDKITVYTPESDLRHPRKLFVQIFRDLYQSRELAWRLLYRNISAQYRQSFLGILWAFLPPLMATLIWVFLKNSNILSMADTAIPYPVYVMVGTVLWQVFVEAITTPLSVVQQSKSMLAKINFPHEALLLTAIGQVIFNFLIKAILLVFVFLWFSIVPSWTIVYAIGGVLLIILLGMMLGILLTPFGMLFGDFQRMVTVFTGLWFFLTPIVYPVPKSGVAALLADFNPISPLLITTRDWLTTGAVAVPNSFWVVTGGMLILFAFGLVVYKVAMPHIIERIGS